MKMLFAAPLLALLALPALAQTPDGSGDPLAISCRAPQSLPDSRLMGPKVCKTNARWAQYRRDGMDVAADGLHDVPTEKWRSTNPQYCYRGPVNSGSTSNAMKTSFSPVCF
jgi:hypothetical protein